MKRCLTCGGEFEDRCKFCPECGAATGASAESGAEGSGRKSSQQSAGGSQNAADESMGDALTMAGSGKGSSQQSAVGSQNAADGLSMGDALTMPGSGEKAGDGGRKSEALEERYELLEELGRGGFARVWKARDRKLGRLVAVKRLTPEGLSGPEGERTLERFRREAQAVASLNHRNIVGVYDRGEDAQGPYIVMELVGGGSLRGLLKERGRLELPEAVRTACAVARGLEHAHRKNLVHRDIKPANILLLKEGDELVPKIADFGLARAGTDTGVSLSGYGMGTPAYMPPEQRRDAKSVNHTADLYALGKTIYEMVTGLPPDDVDFDKLPPALAEIVKKCVKPDPVERYFSAAELLADLEKAGAQKPEAGGQKPAGGSAVCPACGKGNAENVKFCVGCGAGLTLPCPECGADNPVHSPFCGACGTDAAGFGRFRDGVMQMEKFAKEKQWSRVLKEHGLLPAGVRMPGAKGRELVQRAARLKDAADEAQVQRETLNKAVEDARAGGDWGEALRAARACRELDPQDGRVATLVAELEARVEEEDWEAAASEAGRLEAEACLADAVEVLRTYAREHAEGQYASEAKAELTRLERLVKMSGSMVRLFRAHDFDGAYKAVSEMEGAGFSAEGATAMLNALKKEQAGFEMGGRLRRRSLIRKGVALVSFAVVAAVAVNAVSCVKERDRAQRVSRLWVDALAAKDMRDLHKVLTVAEDMLAIRPGHPQVLALKQEAERLAKEKADEETARLARPKFQRQNARPPCSTH